MISDDMNPLDMVNYDKLMMMWTQLIWSTMINEF
jgi:hypothetical protein